MENVNTAVILAAGRGLRMKEAGLKRPKGFIEIGTMPIVEESVIRLAASGIRHMIIVTGHLPHHYMGLAARYPDLITLVPNPLFAKSGSMYSLSLVIERIEADFLLLESDLVYERRALVEVLGHPESDVMLVSRPTGSGDEVYVEVSDDRRLRAMAKDRTRLGLLVIGEMVGITKLSLGCFRAMKRYADEVFKTTLKLEYEDALVAVGKLVPVYCHLVDDLAWSEIDNEAHLLHVRNTVYPDILVRESKSDHRAGS